MRLSRQQLDVELRRGAQPERTSLAWMRTLLVLGAALGLIGVHGYVSGISPVLAGVSLASAAAVLLTGSALAHRRLHHIERGIRERMAVQSLAPTLTVTVATVTVAVIALLAITSPSW